MADYSNIPDYDDLPEVKGMPKGCAWGIFDKDGKKDNYGCLNLLTPKVIKEAIAEAKDGVSVSLKCACYSAKPPFSLMERYELLILLFFKLANWRHQ